MLVIDFCNEKNERYTLRYNLPPDTPERTERRVSLLLYLLRKQRPGDIDEAPPPIGA
ncbi:hypothetical protein [Serratia ficaria]|uniref:hypothetical protein n=1 Tax=Serratia ficaria TaxID=61651 RepID=UPI001E34A4B1|nr:hypothetical protein [Serratia ficaria]